MALDTVYPELDEAAINAIAAKILFKDSWTDATDAEKNTALYQAVEVIERLNYTGSKYDADQTYQFPRNTDTTVPTDIHKAIVYIAIALLDGRDPDFEYQNLAMKSESVAGIRTTFAHTVSQAHIAAGVPSVSAWRHLLPYLRDKNTFSLERA